MFPRISPEYDSRAECRASKSNERGCEGTEVRSTQVGVFANSVPDDSSPIPPTSGSGQSLTLELVRGEQIVSLTFTELKE